MNTPQQSPLERHMSPERVSIRDAAEADIDSLAAIHEAAFPGFFLTSLGPAFLGLYYRCVRENPGGILRLAVVRGRPAGFVAGFSNPAQFYASLRSRRVSLALAVARRMLRRPGLLARFVADYRRTGAKASARDPFSSELSSLAVLPDHGGLGLGRRLVEDFVRASAARGARTVVLTTDAVGNDRVNRFYVRCGFHVTGELVVRSRVLNEYVYDLSGLNSGYSLNQEVSCVNPNHAATGVERK